MQAAEACNDDISSGEVNHRLGVIYQQQNDWQRALAFQQAYLQLSRHTGDKAAEGMACCAFSECQQRLGDLDGAIKSLEDYLELSTLQVSCQTLAYGHCWSLRCGGWGWGGDHIWMATPAVKLHTYG